MMFFIFVVAFIFYRMIFVEIRISKYIFIQFQNATRLNAWYFQVYMMDMAKDCKRQKLLLEFEKTRKTSIVVFVVC